jgi:hypothetical protein
MPTPCRPALRSFLTKQRSKLSTSFLTSALVASILTYVYKVTFLPSPDDYQVLNRLLVSAAFWVCAKAVSAIGRNICLSAISAPIPGFASPLETTHTLVWLVSLGCSALYDLAERILGLALIAFSILTCSAVLPLVTEHGLHLLHAPLSAGLTFALCLIAVVLGAGGAGQVRLSRTNG